MSFLPALVSGLSRLVGEQSPGQLSVLIYHRVRPERDPLQPGDPTIESFRSQMQLIARHLRPVPLTDGLSMLASGRLPSRAVAVTFDDGYADNSVLAAPILTEFGVPATFFIATGFLDGGRMWNDSVIESVRRWPAGRYDLSEVGLGTREISDDPSRLALVREILAAIKHRPQDEREAVAGQLGQDLDLPRDLMMTSEQVESLAAAGFEIGGHTVSHPILATLTLEHARSEIDRGRQRLEAITGRKVRHFAYPNGRPGDDYLPEHVDLVRNLGFEAAVSTRQGLCGGATDRWQLPRIAPWNEPGHRFLLRRLLEFRQAR